MNREVSRNKGYDEHTHLQTPSHFLPGWAIYASTIRCVDEDRIAAVFVKANVLCKDRGKSHNIFDRAKKHRSKLQKQGGTIRVSFWPRWKHFRSSETTHGELVSLAGISISTERK